MLYQAILEEPEKREMVLRGLLGYLPGKYNTQDISDRLGPAIERLTSGRWEMETLEPAAPEGPKNSADTKASTDELDHGDAASDSQDIFQENTETERKLRAACMAEVYRIEPDLAPETKYRIADALYNVLSEAPGLRRAMLRVRLAWMGRQEAQSVSDRLQPAIMRLTSYQDGAYVQNPASEKELLAACLTEIRKANLGDGPGRNHELATSLYRAVLADPDSRIAVFRQQMGMQFGRKKREGQRQSCSRQSRRWCGDLIFRFCSGRVSWH